MASALEKRRAWAESMGYIDLARKAEAKYGLPSGVGIGMLEQESGWFEDVINGKRKSSAGAIGIGQFMPATAEEEGIDPLNVPQAIDGAMRYLAKLQKQTNSWSGALTAYNWGIGNYKKWQRGEKKTIPKEAREYAPGVLARANDFGSLQSGAPEVDALSDEPVQQTPASAPVPDTPLIEPEAPAQSLLPTQSAGAAQTSSATMSVSQPDPATMVSAGATQSGSLLPSLAPTSSTIDFKMANPKAPTITIDTPEGPRQVVPETEEEEELVTELGQTGERGLLSMVPTLLKTRDKLSAKPLINLRGDALDRLLGDIVSKVN